jgi:hypothetical protein
MYEKIDYDLLVEILLKKVEWNLQHQIQTFNKIKHILGSVFFCGGMLPLGNWEKMVVIHTKDFGGEGGGDGPK